MREVQRRRAKFVKLYSMWKSAFGGDVMTRKKIAITVILLALAVLLFPIRDQLKDGGTVRYTAALYRVSKVHKLISVEEMEREGKVKEFDDGIIVELLGFEVFNNVK